MSTFENRYQNFQSRLKPVSKEVVPPMYHNSFNRNASLEQENDEHRFGMSLMPSLVSESSSPPCESPQTLMPTSIHSSHSVLASSPPRALDYNAYAYDETKLLPSSPPTPIYEPPTAVQRPISTWHNRLSPKASGTKRSYDLTNLKGFASSPIRPSSSGQLSLGEFLSPRKRHCPQTSKGKLFESALEGDSNDGADAGYDSDSACTYDSETEYNITGLQFGFKINSRTGRAEVGSLRAGRTNSLPPLMQRLLDDESDDELDCDSENRWNDEYISTGDAIDEFARLLAKSRVQKLEGRRQRGHKAMDSIKLDPNDCTFFNNVPSETDLPSSCPSTPLLLDSTFSKFNPILETPQGFPLAYATTPSYSTGLTP